MEDSEWGSELWEELGRQATEAPSEDVKGRLFPVAFQARTPLERFRSLVLDGYLPLLFYILFLTAWGSNFSHSHPPLAALLATLLLGLVLSWALAPLFQFHRLRSFRDIVPLFFLGLLVPIPYSLFSALQAPRWSRGFVEEFTAVFHDSAAPTTLLPLFLISLLVAWLLKLWTVRIRNDAPWFEPIPKTKLRRALAYSLLSTPLWLYGMCLLGSQPSRDVQRWRTQSVTFGASSSPWLPAAYSLSESAWAEVEKSWEASSALSSPSPQQQEKLAELALENLQSGYHQGAWMLESLQRGAPPSLRAGLVAYSIPAGLTKGESLLANSGFERIRELAASRVSDPEELRELASHLRRLQDSFPSDDQALESLLRHFSSRPPQKPFSPLSLNWILSQRGLSPRNLSHRYQLHQCIELWLQYQASGQDLSRQNLSREIMHLTSRWGRSSHPYLALRQRYWRALDFYRTALELQLYRREQGYFPHTLTELGRNDSPWLYIHGDGESYPLTVLRDPENELEQVRFES